MWDFWWWSLVSTSCIAVKWMCRTIHVLNILQHQLQLFQQMIMMTLMMMIMMKMMSIRMIRMMMLMITMMRMMFINIMKTMIMMMSEMINIWQFQNFSHFLESWILLILFHMKKKMIFVFEHFITLIATLWPKGMNKMSG